MNQAEAKAKLQSAKQKLKDVRQANLHSPDGSLFPVEVHSKLITAYNLLDEVIEALPK